MDGPHPVPRGIITANLIAGACDDVMSALPRPNLTRGSGRSELRGSSVGVPRPQRATRGDQRSTS